MFLRRTILAAFLLCGAYGSAFAQTPDALERDRREIADGLMSRGLFALAVPEYEALSKLQPPPAELDVILYRLAECQRQTGDLAAATKTARRVMELFPKSPVRYRAAMTAGLVLLSQNKPVEAGDCLDDVTADPAVAPDIQMTALYHAGEAREAAGNLESAEIRFADLVRRAPQAKKAEIDELAAYAALRLASLRARSDEKGASDDAIARYRAIAAKPFSPRIGAEALFQLGSLCAKLGRHADAVAAFRDLEKRYPGDARVRDSLLTAAWSNYRVGRPADALALLDKPAAGKDGDSHPPPSDEAAYLRANCLAALLRRADAVQAYEELVRATPSSPYAPSARYERIVALFQDEQHEAVLREAATLTPALLTPRSAPEGKTPALVADDRFADVLWMQAESAEALKDDGRAIQFYRLLATRYPKSRYAPTATYRLAYRLQNQKKWSEASRAYLALATVFPSNALAPKSLFSSGICLAQAGQSENALRDWHRLLTSFPADETVPEALYQQALEQIRRKDGRAAAVSLDTLLALAEGKGQAPAESILPAEVLKNAKLVAEAKRRSAEARFWRARIRYEAGEYPEAEKDVRACLAAKPAEEVAREASFLLGLALQAQGREAEAATVFQPLLKAASEEKFTPERLVWLADFQFRTGKYKEARDAARELVERKVSPELVQIGHALSGRASLALSETNAAAASLRLAADSPAKSRYGAEAALRLADILLAGGENLEEAAKYYNLAAVRASSPDLLAIRANAYFGLGRTAERRGQSDAAIRYYYALAVLFDERELVTSALTRAAALLKAAGRAQEAEEALAELKQRYP